MSVDGEQMAAGELAGELDRCARLLRDAANSIDHLAQRARAADGNGEAGYHFFAAQALNSFASLLPNMGLPHAFEYAALADRCRDEKEDR